MAKHVQLIALADYVIDGKPIDVSSLEHLGSCLDCQADMIRWLRQLDTLDRARPPKSAVESALETFRKDIRAA